MKKLIVLLLALAVTAGAFAQAAAPAPAPALKLSGALYGGLEYGTADDLVSFDRNYGASTNAFRVRLNGSYSNETVGASFRFQTNAPATAPTYARAFGWAKFFKGMLTVNVGKLGDYTFATPYNSYGNFDGQEGMEFVVAPVANLKAGVFVPVAVAGGKTLTNTMKDLAFGASYSVKDVGDLMALYNLSDTKKPTLTGGFNLKAVKNLAAYLEVSVAELGDDTAGVTTVFEYGSYTLDKLNVTVYAYETLYADTTKDTTVDAYLETAYQLTEALSVGPTAYVGLLGSAGDWNVGAAGTLVVKNSSLEFGATFDQDSEVAAYSQWTFNF